MIDSKVYDKIHLISLLIAPTIVFISAVLAALNVPYAPVITAILGAFDIFVGTVVKILKNEYDKQMKEISES